MYLIKLKLAIWRDKVQIEKRVLYPFGKISKVSGIISHANQQVEQPVVGVTQTSFLICAS
jgi:hypothetical protein